MLRVLVNGADGRMGSQVVKAVYEDKELEFVGGVSVTSIGEDCGELAGIGTLGIPVREGLAKSLEDIKPDVVVDFTIPKVIFDNAKIVMEHGIHMVVGTTGLTASQRNELGKIADEHKTNIFIAPNFSIGAVLMMKISEIIAPYMPDAEIIELHHNNKLDAPSGTAILTAAKINDARKAAHVEAALDKTHESLEGARGAKVDDIPVHSVRLPGYVAHQQVLFGGYGELLTIRHDSLDRKSFMPGVILAVKKVGSYPGLTFGLENFL
ncbi:MAG: 4-hydroxy-tetrahydrodipicolinate reductase [Megasphaera sp.]|jgi:4-hydroxy-tetrahydrodipicolinate reductase|uniref:4-hydroxy-tetrahydrodipicolinate reductase n=1 Tax=Megasphaera sueciensis TaxID=349094 RepID=UPI003D088C14|nr:4-hydroxy-tetrahydrodipicolinate reductase [Megasphaera sp.]MCI1823176.1 4-hydroxy-tetrahydrodipicolinate reductase [Megasphaera sp.]